MGRFIYVIAAALAASLMFADWVNEAGAEGAFAQGPLCQACVRWGPQCCARRSTIQSCIECGLKRFDLKTQTRWCQKNQPICSR